MTKLIIFTIMLLTLIIGNNSVSAQSTTPQWIQNLPAAQNANQLFVVAQYGGRSKALVSMHNRDANGEWQQIMSTNAYIGQNGLGKQWEGDHKTPVGVFKFDRAFGIAPDPGCTAFPYVKINENHYWSGEWNFHYNELVDVSEYGLYSIAGEHLIDYYPHYVYCLNMGYNAECTPGRGSALFLHCFGSNPYTGGCVAISEENMKFVLQNVQADCVLIIDSLENLGGTVN